MRASELVTVARLADHYEDRGVDNPRASAQHDVLKFKREAPELWSQLQDSPMSDRQIGDWVYRFLDRWTRSGMSFKNFVSENPMVRNGHPTDPAARLADLHRQGFMKIRRMAKPQKVERPIVACDACLNWHREGKHTADAATRRRNLASQGKK